jgi:non-specific serine/threonine protein kinase
MLETVREYAREQLDEAGEIDEYARGHARHYFASLETRYEERLGPRRAEALSWCDTEVDNLRAMLDRLTADGSAEAAGATLMLYRFWRHLGAYTEAGRRLQMLLALGDLTDAVRAISLAHLAEMRERLGDLDGAEAAAAEALRLSSPATNARVVALFIASAREVDRGNVDEGVRLARLAAHEAEGVEEAMTRVAALGDLGGTLVQVGRRDEARAVIVDAVEDARRRGLLTSVAWGAGQLGLIDLLEGDYESARRALARAVTHARAEGFYPFEADMLQGLAYAYLGLGRRGDARATFGELLELASRSGRAINPEVALAICGVALAVEPIDLLNGARLRGAVSKLRQDAGGLKRTEWRTDEELECRFEEALIDALGRVSYDDELAVGSAMSLQETIALARSLADS